MGHRVPLLHGRRPEVGRTPRRLRVQRTLVLKVLLRAFHALFASSTALALMETPRGRARLNSLVHGVRVALLTALGAGPRANIPVGASFLFA